MSRGTIAGALIALIALLGGVLGYVLYTQTEAYEIEVARGHGEVGERVVAMSALLNRRDPKNVVPVLVALLADKEAVIRSKAADDLGLLRARDAVEPLLAALAKQAPADRASFIEALGAIGDPRAVAPLAALFDNAGSSEARAIAHALARIGPEAVPVFINHLTAPKPPIRAAAAAGLGWFAAETDQAMRKEVLAPAVAPLIPLLYDPVAEVRGAAADAMGHIRDPKFLTSLMLALGDPDDRVRGAVAKAVSYYGDAAMALLPSAFQSTDGKVRLGAAEAIAALAESGTYDAARAGAPYVKAARGMLDEALARDDLVAGAGAYGYYIMQGKPEAVAFLMAAIKAHGHLRMATALLNCGLPALHDAAAAWAASHGYAVDSLTDPGEYKWGKG